MRTIVYYLLQVRCRQARPTHCHITTNTTNTARRAGSFRFSRPILRHILQLCVPSGAHASARLTGRNSTIVAIPPLCNTADTTRAARFHPISSHGYTQLQDTVQNSPPPLSLPEIVDRFAPGASPIVKGNKIHCRSLDGAIDVLVDIGGGYLRIQDLKHSTRKRPEYLDLSGRNPRYVIVNGKKVRVLPPEQYNPITHFRIKHMLQIESPKHKS